MNPHTLLLTIPNPDVNPEQVEAKLDKAKDWLRYAPGCWLIHTKKSADAWFERISETVDPKNTMVFICEVNLQERSGKLSPDAWKWMKTVREQQELVAS
jgi:hypothetical protein